MIRKHGSFLLVLWLYLSLIFPSYAFDPNNLTEREEYIVGNTLHVALHEAGHMVIDQFKLAVLGQEEDAADNFATVVLIDQDNEFADFALANTAHFWFHLGDNSDLDEAAFFGSHDLDLQRGYRIVCHLVGVDEEAFSYLIEAADLSTEDFETCGDSFELTADSWLSTLENFQPPEDHQNSYNISFEKPVKGSEDAYQILRESYIIPDVTSILDQYVKLPNPVSIIGSNCGEANAYYDLEDISIILCYEMLDFYSQIFKQTE